MKPIYEPKGKASDYAELAVNIYTGCNHGCSYCYAPRVLHKTRDEFGCVKTREGLHESLVKQMDKEETTGRAIHLCFTCDPYPAPPADTLATRKVIEVIKDKGNSVQILTKAGSRAERDFCVLSGEDWYGCTLTWSDSLEPGADPTDRRLASLMKAKAEYGLRTWASIEPVFHPEKVYGLIEKGDYIDLFKFGKLNYAASGIDWKRFAEECVGLCVKHGRGYKLKTDLQMILDGSAAQ